MAILSKGDLELQYSWHTTSNDNPRLIGSPDRDLLNSTEGYEVLNFINNFAEKHRLPKLEAKKLEHIIRNEVPEELHSKFNIDAWIAINKLK